MDMKDTHPVLSSRIALMFLVSQLAGFSGILSRPLLIFWRLSESPMVAATSQRCVSCCWLGNAASWIWVICFLKDDLLFSSAHSAHLGTPGINHRATDWFWYQICVDHRSNAETLGQSRLPNSSLENEHLGELEIWGLFNCVYCIWNSLSLWLVFC